MTQEYRLDGAEFTKLVLAGAENLREHAKEVNELNVFPVPDGDTGDNMMLTIRGGASSVGDEYLDIAKASRKIADGMLLSARGNSGVILSQFFAGIANGLEGVEKAGPKDMENALLCGVEQAYGAVAKPSEGTILTVARMATEYVCSQGLRTVEDVLRGFVEEGYRALRMTPDFLPVLKSAGVVDSGGAGLLYIVDGMLRALTGEYVTYIAPSEAADAPKTNDIELFTSESELEYGYCTECLVRLQSAKTDISEFDIEVIRDYLKSIGDSVVAVKNGSLVKLHVHTKVPGRVFDFCQKYGEFLSVKVENMSLQHNNVEFAGEETVNEAEKKPFGIVAVCSGEGVKRLFLESGADITVDGGQSMNPSAEDLLDAFRRVNAETVFVFPNNSNIILAANQAARLCKEADVRVIESTTVGEGYAAISMFDPSSEDADIIAEELTEAMKGAVTASVSRCVRDVSDMDVRNGEYIGFVGKNILSSSESRLECAKQLMNKCPAEDLTIGIILRGEAADADEAELLRAYLEESMPDKEIYLTDGNQAVYDYTVIFN